MTEKLHKKSIKSREEKESEKRCYELENNINSTCKPITSVITLLQLKEEVGKCSFFFIKYKF